MDDIGAFLYETGVVILVVRADAVQSRGLEFPNVASESIRQFLNIATRKRRDALIGVSEPLHRLVQVPNCAQHNLRIEVIRQLRDSIGSCWLRRLR